MNEQTDLAPQALHFPTPRRVGKYEIHRPLARGAMGVVYHAQDTVLHRSVAVKVMAASIAGEPDLKARFEREARVAAQLTHPNVVTIYDLGYHVDGSPYIAMELLKGADLHRALDQGPPLSLARKVSIMVQVLDGLAHAHRAGIIHRDIKPANIFIKTDGSVKILDFGVARLVQAAHSTGGIVGTADYMSPEQVRGALVDGRSDVFSCGCVFFEMVTGRGPFHSDNIANTVFKITHSDPEFDLVPADPEHLRVRHILERALAKDVEERYQSAEEFAAALVELADFRGTAASGRRLLEDLLPLELPPSSLQPLGEGGPRAPEPARVGNEVTVDLRTGAAEASRPNEQKRVRRAAMTLPPTSWRHRAKQGGLLVLAGALLLALYFHRGGRPSQGPAPTEPSPAAASAATAATETIRPETSGPAPSAGALPRDVLSLPESQTERARRPAPAPAKAPAVASSWRPPEPMRREAAPAVKVPKDAPSAAPAAPSPGPSALTPPVSVAAPPAPAVSPPEDLPAARRGQVLSRFEGYLTDSVCREKGAISDHWQCMVRCMKDKRAEPMFYMKGRLYALVGLDRIWGDHDRAVNFYGYLDPETDTITVAGAPK